MPNAFHGCLFTQISIPPSVTSIEEYAFSDCTSLSLVSNPSSVTSSGDYAFTGCTSLKQITIPSSVTSIGLNAFHKCPITRIAIPPHALLSNGNIPTPFILGFTWDTILK